MTITMHCRLKQTFM